MISMSALELLRELEKLYPDRLPDYRRYSPEATLVAIGNQEIIRCIRKLIDEGTHQL
jgi:hypothetical protein